MSHRQKNRYQRNKPPYAHPLLHLSGLHRKHPPIPDSDPAPLQEARPSHLSPLTPSLRPARRPCAKTFGDPNSPQYASPRLLRQTDSRSALSPEPAANIHINMTSSHARRPCMRDMAAQHDGRKEGSNDGALSFRANVSHRTARP